MVQIEFTDEDERAALACLRVGMEVDNMNAALKGGALATVMMAMRLAEENVKFQLEDILAALFDAAVEEIEKRARGQRLRLVVDNTKPQEMSDDSDTHA